MSLKDYIDQKVDEHQSICLDCHLNSIIFASHSILSPNFSLAKQKGTPRIGRASVLSLEVHVKSC
jgi:hypothetical protein